jgi:hypothetical protein
MVGGVESRDKRQETRIKGLVLRAWGVGLGAWDQETRDKRQESRAWCLELGAWGLGHGIKRQETRAGAWGLGL